MTIERASEGRGLDRRQFLAAAGAIGAAGSGLGARPASRRGPPAKNLILMVCDGAGLGAMTLASQYLEVRGEGAGEWMSLWKSPRARTGLADTTAADSVVTDSAASATCWGTGEMVGIGAVNVTPEGRAPEPLFVRAKRAGKATGLVTTTRVTDATPACMVANVPKREMEREIAGQIVERGVDVVLGGGGRYFGDADLSGVGLVRTREGLRSAPAGGRVFGLFAESHLPWMLDRGPGDPTLEEMTRAALAMLPSRGDGFVLQVEGGLADKGAHSNDAGAMMFDLLEFDRTVGVVREFVEGRDDTLLIVTADHDCAGPGVSVYGAEGGRRLERLSVVRHTFDWIGRRAVEIADEEARRAALPGLVREATGVTLLAEEAEMLVRAARSERVDPYTPANGPWPVLGSLLANHLGVAFLSPNHTSAPVSVTGVGPGAEGIASRGHHIDVHRVMARAIGLI